MLINNFKINLSTISSGVTATTINFPISMNFELVDNSRLIDDKFVKHETENAINSIFDYEKVRFLPVKFNLENQLDVNSHIDNINYILNLDGVTNYGGLGFSNDDIKYQKLAFTNSFLNLLFYDSPNPLTQNLISFNTYYPKLNISDVSLIPIKFNVSNPILNPIGDAQGYYLYDYKDELKIGDTKYLYMRGSFKNAKSGKSINLMVRDMAYSIDELMSKIYTRYILSRTSTGYYYAIDPTYNMENNLNNVTYNGNNITVNLFKLKAL